MPALGPGVPPIPTRWAIVTLITTPWSGQRQSRASLSVSEDLHHLYCARVCAQPTTLSVFPSSLLDTPRRHICPHPLPCRGSTSASSLSGCTQHAPLTHPWEPRVNP